MRMSTIGDLRKNEAKPRAEEGGEHRRHVFLRHNFDGGSRILEFGHGAVWGLHAGASFNVAPQVNPLFAGNC